MDLRHFYQLLNFVIPGFSSSTRMFLIVICDIVSVNVYYVLLWALGPTAFFTCIAHLYLYYTLLVQHTYASYIRHWCILFH